MKLTLSDSMDFVSSASQNDLPQIAGSARDQLASAAQKRCRSIVHVPRRFVSEEWGGTETVVLQTCLQQQMAGEEPVIYTSMALSSRRSEVMQGVPVERFSYCYPFFGLTSDEKKALDKKGGNLLSLPLFNALLNVPNVRLYHAHTLKRVGAVVRTAARIRKKPFVVSLHGGVFDVPAAESASLIKPIEGKWEWGKPFGAIFGSRRVLEDADMVLCVGVTEFQKGRSLLSHDRIAHLPNGVDCARFATGNPVSFRSKLGIGEDAQIILNVSRIDEQKNQMLLLKAFAKAAKSLTDPHLVIIGPETKPDYAAALRLYTSECGLGERVHILAGLKNSDTTLVDAYHSCDVFVLPSAHEPFGIVVLEAWSAGKPVIATNVGGLGSLIEDGVTGLLIEPNAAEDLADKIVLLSQNKELSAKLAAAGKHEANTRYDWSKIALLQEEFYQRAETSAAQRYGRRKS